MYAVQYLATETNSADANAVLAFLAGQVDYIGGRILEPSSSKPGFRVQAFFEDCGHNLPLPDGCRRVWLPPSLRRLAA